MYTCMESMHWCVHMSYLRFVHAYVYFLPGLLIMRMNVFFRTVCAEKLMSHEAAGCCQFEEEITMTPGKKMGGKCIHYERLIQRKCETQI